MRQACSLYHVSKPYRYARKIHHTIFCMKKNIVSKPYRYARKGWDCDVFIDREEVSKPYRYARKDMRRGREIVFWHRFKTL